MYRRPLRSKAIFWSPGPDWAAAGCGSCRTLRQVLPPSSDFQTGASEIATVTRLTADNPERASSRKPPISESPFSRSVRLAASSGEAMEPSVIPLRSRCPGRAPAAL